MGNCKSKSGDYNGGGTDEGGPFGHEMLDESPDDTYFQKIEKRNRVQTRDTTIPPPDVIKNQRRGGIFSSVITFVLGPPSGGNFKAAAPSGGKGDDSTVERDSDREGGTPATVGTTPSVDANIVNINATGVRQRAAMFERAERDAALASAAGRPLASSGINYHNRQRFNLVISPTASTSTTTANGGIVASSSSTSSSSPGDNGGMEVAIGRSRSRSGGTGSTPPRLAASRRDTNRPSAVHASRNGGGGGGGASVASSDRSGYGNNNGNDELLLLENGSVASSSYTYGGSVTSSNNGNAGKSRDAILDYVRADDDARSIVSANTRNALFGSDALSEALVYADVARGDKVSAVAWRVDHKSRWSPVVKGRKNKGVEPILAIGTDDGFVAVVNVEEWKKNRDAAETAEGGSLNSAGGGRNASARSITNGGGGGGCCRELPPREGRIRSLSWSPTDPTHLAVGGDDCTAAIVDVTDLEITAELEREDRIYAVRYAPHGRYIAVGGFDGSVAVATSDTLELLTEINRSPGLVLDLSWHPDGSMLAVGGSDRQASIVDCEGESAWTVAGEIQRSGEVRTVRWDPTGIYLAVGGDDGMVAVVDIGKRKVVRDVPLRNAAHRDDGPLAILPRDHPGRGSAALDGCSVSSACWSPNGAFLAIGGTNGTVAIVETASYAVVQEVKRTAAVTSVDWQENYLAVGGEDRSVAVLKTTAMTSSSSGGTGDDASSIGPPPIARAVGRQASYRSGRDAVGATAVKAGSGRSLQDTGNLPPRTDWVFNGEFGKGEE